jgi:hypothetical protein
MSEQRARSLGAKVIGLTGFVLATACSATTTKPVALGSGAQGYKIECVRIDDCWAEAKKACHGPYRSVQTEGNSIAESDLPGLNARTHENTERHYVYGVGLPGGVPPNGPGIESDEPMPVTEVTVVCKGS